MYQTICTKGVNDHEPFMCAAKERQCLDTPQRCAFDAVKQAIASTGTLAFYSANSCEQ